MNDATPFDMRDNPTHIRYIIGDLLKLIESGEISRVLTRVEETR